MTDLKRIVVLASGEAGDSEALNAAAAIAALHRAVVEIFSIHQDAAGDLISLGLLLGAHRSAETLNAIAAAEKESRDRIAEAAIRCAEAHDLPYGPGPDSPRLVLFDHAFRPPTIEDRTLVLADLTVIGQGYLSKAGRLSAVLGQVLLTQRAPLLIARGNGERVARCAAIAWDGSREAGRAVRMALALLKEASSVAILQYRPGSAAGAPIPDPVRLSAYLELHGVLDATYEAVDGEAEGEALVGAAHRLNIDILVAGAWGQRPW